MDSGFAGGSDDLYNVYDKPWRAGGGMADKIYRPGKGATDKDIYGDDVEKLIKTNRYMYVTVLNACFKHCALQVPAGQRVFRSRPEPGERRPGAV